MKRRFYLAILLILSGCYAPTQIYRLEPSDDENIFTENGKPFAWKSIDSVIVSVGFDTHLNNEFILDMTIDNQSNDTFSFNPSEAYLFLYSSDTSLAEQKIYFAIDPEKRIDSIQSTIIHENKKVKRNAVLSILFAAAYLTSEVVAATSDNISYETMEAVRATHTLSQLLLDESGYSAANNIDYLYFSDGYWHCNAFRKTGVEADTFYTGKIHFNVPYSPLYKVYIPVNGHIYRYEFKGVSELK
jgi:hypothetical protein